MHDIVGMCDLCMFISFNTLIDPSYEQQGFHLRSPGVGKCVFTIPLLLLCMVCPSNNELTTCYQNVSIGLFTTSSSDFPSEWND